MSFDISIEGYPESRSLYAYIHQLTAAGVETNVWDDALGAWDSGSSVPLAANAERITLSAGSGVRQTVYAGTTNGNLDTYTGQVKVYIVDTSLTPEKVVWSTVTNVRSGVEYNDATNLRDVPTRIFNAERNRAATIPVLVKDTSFDDLSPSEAVVSTQYATAAASPSFGATTNAAVYAGTRGLYTVLMTAAELNQTVPIILRVTTSSGYGEVIVQLEEPKVRGDWDQMIEDDAGTPRFTANTLEQAPLAGGGLTVDAIADAVWDEDLTAHNTALTAGKRLIDADATTVAIDGKVDALPDVAAINAEVDTALADIHLDHLLAVAYNSVSPPGSATALLNVLVEDDAGTPRYTANTLEQGPAAGGLTAAAIADAVWEEATAGHATAGTYGLAVTDIDAETQSITNTTDTTNTTVDGINAYVVGTLTTKVDANATPAEVATELVTLGLDHLVSAAVSDTDVVDNSIVAKLAATGGDFSTFAEATDSLEAIRDRGDAQWLGSVPHVTSGDVQRYKDTAGQEVLVYVKDASGVPYTGALTTENISLEGASQVALTNSPTAVAGLAGWYRVVLTQAETNYEYATIHLDDGGSNTGERFVDFVPFVDVSAPPPVVTVSTVQVPTWRQWKLRPAALGAVAGNVITITPGLDAYLSMDFSAVLDEGDAIASVGAVTDSEGTLTNIEKVPAARRTQAHLRFTGYASNYQHSIQVTVNTEAGRAITGRGVLFVQ